MILEFIFFFRVTVYLVLTSCYFTGTLYHPLLQDNISSTFSRQLTHITHLLCTYLFSHYYSTTFHQHSVINLHASLICYILTFFPIITVQHFISIQSSAYTHHSSVIYLPFFPLLQYNISSAFSHPIIPHSGVCLVAAVGLTQNLILILTKNTKK